AVDAPGVHDDDLVGDADQGAQGAREILFLVERDEAGGDADHRWLESAADEKYLTIARIRWSGHELRVRDVLAREFADDVDLSVALQAASRHQGRETAALIEEESPWRFQGAIKAAPGYQRGPVRALKLNTLAGENMLADF